MSAVFQQSSGEGVVRFLNQRRSMAQNQTSCVFSRSLTVGESGDINDAFEVRDDIQR